MSIRINNSLLKLLAACETQAYLRWGQELIWKEKQGAGPMEVGQILHVALAAWLQGEEQSTILATFDAGWPVIIGDIPPQQARLQYANVRLCLQHWMAQQPRRDMNVLQTETMFEVPLGTRNGEEIVYYGTPDTLVEWKGEKYIIDHKSTGDITDDWSAQWTMDSGLQGYVWGLRQLGHAVKGAFVNGIEVTRLPPWDGNLEKKCQTHKVKYKECQPVHVKGQWVGPLFWSDARLAQWKRDVLAQVGRLVWLRHEAGRDGLLDNVKMDGQWRWPGCNGGRGRAPCQYRGFCQAGRPVQGMQQMMVHADWRRGVVVVEEEV